MQNSMIDINKTGLQNNMNPLNKGSDETYKNNFIKKFEEYERDRHRELCLKLIMLLDFDDVKLNRLFKSGSNAGLQRLDEEALKQHLDKKKLSVFDTYLLLIHLIRRNNLTMIQRIVDSGVNLRCARSFLKPDYWRSVRAKPSLWVCFIQIPGFIKKMSKMSISLDLKHDFDVSAQSYFRGSERFSISLLSIANHCNRPDIFQYIYLNQFISQDTPFFIKKDVLSLANVRTLIYHELLRSGITSLLDQVFHSKTTKDFYLIQKLLKYRHFSLVDKYWEFTILDPISSPYLQVFLDDDYLEYFYLSDKQRCLSLILKLKPYDSLFEFATNKNYTDIIQKCLEYPSSNYDFIKAIALAFKKNNVEVLKLILSMVQFNQSASDEIMNQAIKKSLVFAKIAFEYLDDVSEQNLHCLIEVSMREGDHAFVHSLVESCNELPTQLLDKCLHYALIRINQDMISYLYDRGARPVRASYPRQALAMLPAQFEYREQLDTEGRFKTIKLKQSLATIPYLLSDGKEIKEVEGMRRENTSNWVHFSDSAEDISAPVSVSSVGLFLKKRN